MNNDIKETIDPVAVTPPSKKTFRKAKLEGDAYYMAGQWQLMWWRFRKHKLAIVGGSVLALMYLLAIFAEFVTPYDTRRRFSQSVYAPPQRVRMFHEGRFIGPFVHGYTQFVNLETFQREYTEDPERIHRIRLFVHGEPYRFWGIFDARIRLFGIESSEVPLLLLGSDALGRCVYSRIVYGARVSLTIGLVGVIVSLFIGLFFGGISGFYGGWIDDAIQRLIEFLRSIPTIPLWMGLSAALPADWPLMHRYFAITIILSILGWTSLARVVRGKLMSTKTEDFVMAAKVCGVTDGAIIGRHLIPSFMSYIIVNLTLAVPHMILGETALSFLGLGLRPPVVSWGVLLQQAQNMRTVAVHPWLLIPALAVIITVLAFNFLGDGLRDAADPYK